MKVEIEITQPKHIEALLADLLPADRAEVKATGFEVEYAIRASVEQSLETYALSQNGRLGSIIGVIEPDMVSAARPWMLSTTLILDRPKEVVKLSRLIYSQWIDRYGYLANHVDQRHTRAVQWLRWLGARFTPEPKFGPYSRPFYLFEFGEP